MRALAFAARSLARQPGRAAVGILGIAAVGALLFDMLLLSRGLVVSFRELLDSIGFDVRVTATDIGPIGGPRLSGATAIASDVGALPEVAQAVPMLVGDAEASKGRDAIVFSLIGIELRGRRPWTTIRGADLDAAVDAPPTLLLNRLLADLLQVSPGDSIALRLVCGSHRTVLPPARYRVAGIADFPFDDETQLTGVVARGRMTTACGAGANGVVDEADMVLIASREGVTADAAVAAIRRRRPELRAATNEQIVARMQDAGFTYFRQISTVLSTITMLFGFLLINVLLTVSVNQRLSEIAALRALGFSRARVAGDVLCQSALLVGLGGLLALPLGAALSVWLDAILKKMPGIPSSLHFFVFEPRALALHASLLAATALLAAIYPMRLVSTLPIAATLRNEVVS
jgi:putative ABC transport system permease protein